MLSKKNALLITLFIISIFGLVFYGEKSQLPKNKTGLVSDFTTGLNLKEQEGGLHKGHTISRHVNKTFEELSAQLDKSSDAYEASSFTSTEIAEKAISEAMLTNKIKIEEWFNNKASNKKLVFDYHTSYTIGKVVKYLDENTHEASDLRIVLTKSNHQIKLISAYPIIPAH